MMVRKMLGRAWATRERRAVGGMITVNACSAVLSLTVTIVLARLLGVSQYGLYAYAISISGLVGGLAALGIPTLVLRQASVWSVTSQWRLFRGIIRFGIVATFISSMLFGILLVNINPFLGRISHAPGFVISLSLAAVVMVCTTVAQVLEAVLQSGKIIVGSIVPRVIVLPAGILAYAIGGHMLGLSLSARNVLVAQSVVGIAMLLCLLRMLERVIPAEALGVIPVVHPVEWLSSALPFLGNNIMFVINTQVDILLLGYFKGGSSAAVYRVGTRGAQILVLSLTAIVAAVQPRMAALFAEGRHKELAALVTRTTRTGFYIALAAAAMFVAGGRQIIFVLFGQPFIAAADVLMILTICRLAHAGTGSLGAFLSMTGKERILMKALMAESAANIVFNVVLIPRWGVVGAALATGISMAAMNTLLAFYVYRKWGVDVSIWGKNKSVTSLDRHI